MNRCFLTFFSSAAFIAIAEAQVTGPETRLCGDYGAPHPDMPDEFSQFSFIIGDYDVGIRNWDEETGDWGAPQFFARWNGRYIFGGRAIADEWYDPGYGSREQSGAGVNIRIFDPEAGLWETAWHYTANYEVRELHQQVRDDGKLWLWQVYPAAPERRVYFETYEGGEWGRISLRLDEDTGEWVNAVKLHAVPASCAGGK